LSLPSFPTMRLCGPSRLLRETNHSKGAIPRKDAKDRKDAKKTVARLNDSGQA